MTQSSTVTPIELNLTAITPYLHNVNVALRSFDSHCEATLARGVALGIELLALRVSIVSQFEKAKSTSIESREGQIAWRNYAKENIPISITHCNRFINLARYYITNNSLPLHSSIGAACVAIGASEQVLKSLQQRESDGENITRKKVTTAINFSRNTVNLKKSIQAVSQNTLKIIDGQAPNELSKEQWLILRDELTDTADRITAIIKKL
jgi:hypothetical protein